MRNTLYFTMIGILCGMCFSAMLAFLVIAALITAVPPHPFTFFWIGFILCFILFFAIGGLLVVQLSNRIPPEESRRDSASRTVE